MRVMINAELKLFVVGESSGDPAEWGDPTWRRAIVAARSAAEAAGMVEFCKPEVAELRPTAPVVLFVEDDIGRD